MPLTLLVGSTKGVFLIDADASRSHWTIRGPFCDGWGINHVIGDPDHGTIWSAGGGDWVGAGVYRSDDRGETWRVGRFANGGRNAFVDAHPDEAAHFGMEREPPAPFTGVVETLWSLGRSNGRLFAGARPAALYASDDGGDTWVPVPGLNEHATPESWRPGGAGLVLHTIAAVPEVPEKLWVAISAAGVFVTEDGGATWERRNRLSNAGSADHRPHPGHDPLAEPGEAGACVHNFVRATGAGDLLYQQNRHGVFRSGDDGRSWQDVTE